MKNSRSPLPLKRCWTINIPLFLGCLLFAFLSMPSRGFALISIDINSPSMQKIQIAIPDFKDLTPLKGRPELAIDLPSIISSDLDFSGYFIPMDKKAFLEQGGVLTPEAINFKNWTVIGAELLLTSGYTIIGTNNIEVEIRLYDTYLGKELMAQKFLGKLDSTRILMHRISNEIIYTLTGSKGPFLSKIVFVNNSTGNKEIYMCDFDGQNIMQLTSYKSISLLPRWSPEGGRVAFNSYKDGDLSLYIMNSTSRGVSRVPIKDGAPMGGAAWEPNGDVIAIPLKKNGNADIFNVDTKGNILVQQTNHWGIDTSPAFSPDGTKMAFISSRSGSPQIYIKDLGTGNEERITFDLDYCASPSWSKSNRIVFSVMKDNKVDIYAINPDGSNMKRLTEENGNNEDPCWSPDGRYILFSSNRDGGGYHLYMMGLDGQNQKRVTNLKGNDTAPSWSPY